MDSGKILVAKKNGVYVLKLEGDVRLTICAALEMFLEKMILEPDLEAVFIDLTDTIAVDSTTLGFLAKISIQTKKKFNWIPTIITVNDDITRVLMSMGFDQVFDFINERIDQPGNLEELNSLELGEDAMKGQVLEAHKILMGLNEQNRSKFKELIDVLEAS